MTKPPPTKGEAYNQAFAKAVTAFARNVPLLLHGSGDVAPSQVDPKTVHLVSSLTAQYVARLVDASLDSHFTYLDNGEQPAAYVVPPPSFPNNKDETLCKPPPFSVTHPPEKATTAATATAVTATGAAAVVAALLDDASDPPPQKRPKKRLREEYWDDGLPPPKIKSQQQQQPPEDTAATSVEDLMQSLTDADAMKPQVPLDEWVGAVGVDLRKSAIRKAHVTNAISTPSFVFPICHDVYAYNRVREIRAAKRTLNPLLQDATIQEMIKTEGGRHYRRLRRLRFREGAANTTGGEAKKDEEPPEDDEDDDDDDEGAEGADGELEWPGLDYVLPVNMLNNLKYE